MKVTYTLITASISLLLLGCTNQELEDGLAQVGSAVFVGQRSQNGQIVTGYGMTSAQDPNVLQAYHERTVSNAPPSPQIVNRISYDTFAQMVLTVYSDDDNNLSHIAAEVRNTRNGTFISGVSYQTLAENMAAVDDFTVGQSTITSLRGCWSIARDQTYLIEVNWEDHFLDTSITDPVVLFFNETDRDETNALTARNSKNQLINVAGTRCIGHTDAVPDHLYRRGPNGEISWIDKFRTFDDEGAPITGQNTLTVAGTQSLQNLKIVHFAEGEFPFTN